MINIQYSLDVYIKVISKNHIVFPAYKYGEFVVCGPISSVFDKLSLRRLWLCASVWYDEQKRDSKTASCCLMTI